MNPPPTDLAFLPSMCNSEVWFTCGWKVRFGRQVLPGGVTLSVALHARRPALDRPRCVTLSVALHGSWPALNSPGTGRPR